ncbi:ABC transporter ATP-binding protein [Nocardioides sp. NPDC004968]|uniref:ABC transporter ATP-binding protein n=1 Tax=Nocardioides sp. NPDC004968 TaxID=3155894 RepID=UPI0033A8A55B
MTAQSLPLLAIEDLTVDFDGRRLLDGVNICVEPGQRVGLVGESGSGKSLTSRVVMGVLPDSRRWKTNGSVRFKGTDLLALPDREYRKVRGDRLAIVFQEPSAYLNPTVRVVDQVAEVLRIHRQPRDAKARAVELLERVGLEMTPRMLAAYPFELSGGQKQRAMLAMAMICTPDLLIADEPTTALDVTVQAKVLRLMRDVTGESSAGVLFITHDLGVVAQFCEYVYVMQHGRIVEHAPVEQIFQQPREEYTRVLLNSARKIAGMEERTWA